jgi:hypothetical protein
MNDFDQKPLVKNLEYEKIGFVFLKKPISILKLGQLEGIKYFHPAVSGKSLYLIKPYS